MEILSEGSILANLQRFAKSLKITDHVRFLGQVPKTEMPFSNAASDISIDPCLFGQGYASLEAMACGSWLLGLKKRNN